MSARLAHSMTAAGVVLAIWVLLLAGGQIRRVRSAGRPRRAMRLAQDLGIVVPRESAGRLEERLRRRTMSAILLAGPLVALWTGWYFYAELLAPWSDTRPSTLPPQVAAMPVWALGGVTMAAAHLHDLVRSSRTAGNRVARIVEPRLADAVPPVLTWTLRGVALLPALAAAAWLLAPVTVQHGPHAAHPHPLSYLAAALLAPITVAATEAGQRRILRGRQNATTAHELAFDDALRVQTMLAVMVVPLVLCTGAAALIVASLSRDFDWSGAFPVFTAMTVVLAAFVAFPLTAQSKWARRYYLRHFAAYSAPGPAGTAARAYSVIMLIRVEADSAVPPYEQVRAQIAALVRSGDLAVGTRLPTVRKLAEDLGLAANTVARSYKELEADSVIETRGRHGTFVAAVTDAQQDAAAAAAAYVELVQRLGLPDEEALNLVAAALASRGH